MATKNVWDTEEIVIPEDGTIEETPEVEALQEQPSPAPSPEAIQDVAQSDESDEPVEEDRLVLEFPRDQPSINRLIEEYKEQHPEFKRAFNNRVAQTARRETAEVIRRQQAEIERLTEERLKAEKAVHELFWANKTPAERAQLFAQNPNLINAWQNREKVDQKLQEVQSRPQPPQWLRDLKSEADDFLEAESDRLSEEDADHLRKYLNTPEFWAWGAQNPQHVLTTIQGFIDERIPATQNSGVRTAEPPRVPAPTAATPAPRVAPNVVRGNSRASNYAPEGQPRSRNGGGSVKPITEADAAAMNPDQWGAFLDSIGAKSAVQAKTMGYLKD